MSLGEVREVCEDVYAYLQPDGSWYVNNTGSSPPLAPMRNGARPGLCRCDGAAFGRGRAAGRRD